MRGALGRPLVWGEGEGRIQMVVVSSFKHVFYFHPENLGKMNPF